MSAFVSIKFPDSIQLLADGTAYDSEGVITSFENKVRSASQVPLAIAVRGASGYALALADGLCAIADERGVDAFVQHVEAFAGWLSTVPWPADRGFDFAIGAFSPTRGACHFRLHTYPTMPDFPAFRLHELGIFLAAGTMFDVQELCSRGILPVTGDATNWARRKAGGIFDLMRERPGDPLPGEADQRRKHLIGGHVDLASISEAGVEMRRIRTWPDEVGAPIDPFADTNVVLLRRCA